MTWFHRTAFLRTYITVRKSYAVYDRNHYFGFVPLPKLKPKLVDTFSRYRNRYRNHISKGKSSYQFDLGKLDADSRNR